jgi:hypothetical protein
VANRINEKKFGNHRLGVNPSVPNKILNDRVYYGNLYFGSSGVELPLMFDTGSEILAVQTIDCKEEFTNFCHENQYDYTTSNRFSKLTLAKTERTYYQAQIWLRGNMCQDIICVTPNDNCVDPFQFLGVTQMLGLPS